MRHLFNILITLSFLALLPVCAFAQNDVSQESEVVAQESDGADIGSQEELGALNAVNEIQVVKKSRTKQDNFKGWFLGFELHYGAEFGEDLAGIKDSDNIHSGPITGVPYAGMLLIDAGYLWGNDFFIGPMGMGDKIRVGGA